MTPITSNTPMTGFTLTGPTPRLADIAHARRTVMQEHNALPAGWIAPWTERSWQHCMSLGLQPNEPVIFDVVTHQRLVQTAKPILEGLGRAIVNTRYFAILTNTDGVAVDVSGPINHSAPRAFNITHNSPVDRTEPASPAQIVQ